MKIFTKFMMALLLVAFAMPVFSATNLLPSKHHSGFLGKSGKAWYATYSDYFYLTGGTAFKIKFTGTPTADRTITFQDGSGTVAFTTDVSTAASAWDDLTSPDAAKTHAMTTYAQTFTSTKTDGDMFNFQGLGAFGDVSVMRIEQKTGNATDGTVLEVVSADADVDALLVTANATSVLQVTGAGAFNVTGDTTITGALSATTLYQSAIAAAASGNANLSIDAAGTGTITVGGTSTGNTNFNGNVNIGNAATDTLTVTSIVDSNLTLDDGTTDSPSLILKDATDETATLTKTDGSVTTFTTAAAGGLSIRTGNLWIGNGSPGVAAMNGEDFYCEGVSEFDALATFDAGVTVTGAAVNLNDSSNFGVNIGTGSNNGAVVIGGGSSTLAIDTTTWDVSTAGAFTGVTGITGAAGEAMTVTIASDGAADDLTLSVTGANDSSVILNSAGTGADAIKLVASAGGIEATASKADEDQIKLAAAGTVAGNAINLVTTDGGIVLTAGGAANGDLTMTVGDDAALNATGTVAITSSDWGISATGAATKMASIGFDSLSVLYQDTVALSNADIKALSGTKKELVAAPGAGYFVEVVSVVLILDYGSEVLTESADNLVVEYATSGDDITAAIEMTGFIDQSADTIMIVQPANPLAANAAADMANNAVQLFNTGDGEFGGNASNDTVMTVKIAYRIHPTGL